MLLEAGKFILALLLLLGGIRGVSRSLQQLAGGKFHGLLTRSVSTPWRGFCVGLTVTTVLQSSSLVTVMVVGFINGSFLTLTQGLGVVIGANLGTTITSQLFSIETGFLIIPLIIGGLAFYFLELFISRPLGGKALLSIAVVLCGIQLLVITLEPFAHTDTFHHLFTFSRGTLWRGIITGTTAAAIIQSSSVTIGMVILMAKEGYLTFPEALAIVVGADLGTCLTALLASIGTIPSAKRVALGHLFFNLTSIFLVVLFWKPFLRAAEITSSDIARQVANSHALYNLLGAAVFLPLVDKYAIILQNIGGGQKDRLAGRKKVGI
jgi:phosphate:Na+ symporter